uniref:phenylalanine--tRNA ligase n=1 Tax=Palisada sp. TaxID=1955416 RepID=A0A1Z1MSW5_9FLOR|nr:Phenylalanine-tRNA ligase beta subunit [Palisada sp.]
MKFSWKLINIFINLQDIQLDKFEEQLTLSGIEIEDINHVEDIKDNVFQLSLTTNRKEIFSILSLAKEVGIVLNKGLKVFPINFFTTRTERKIPTKDNYNKQIIYRSINKISNIQIKETPYWLNYYLKVHDIKQTDTISNIQKYIQLKWGIIFDIIETNKLTNINNLLSIEIDRLKLESLKLENNKNRSKLIIFQSKNSVDKQDSNSFNDYEEYYLNACIDATKLISTLTGCIHGKVYHQYNDKQSNYKKIIINRNEINTILGKTNSKTFNQLPNKNILLILKRSNLYPQYNKFLQTFTVKVPNSRRHDLQRKIDIIEEIGRINGFNNFFDKIPSNKNKGITSNLSITIKIIRNTLRQLGFHEVINCCLINNNSSKDNKDVTIYNPITQEQPHIRSSITQSLIENYQNNIKQNNNTVTIFEIGKTFQKNKQNSYIENISIGGLIHNKHFTRNNWSDTPKYPNFFQVKGIIETILEQLKTKATFKKICNHESINYTKKLEKLFDSENKIGIYNMQTEEFIGILGEINPKYKKELNTNKYKIYIFEINIEKLHTTIELSNHLKYVLKPYSNYPSVTRDISIKIKKENNLREIEYFFLENKNPLIESIEIFNEYFNQKYKYKSIGIRITYRSPDKTLNYKDIENIDNQVNKILSNFESKT